MDSHNGRSLSGKLYGLFCWIDSVCAFIGVICFSDTLFAAAENVPKSAMINRILSMDRGWVRLLCSSSKFEVLRSVPVLEPGGVST